MEHLRAELRRLDLLLHREILRLRASYQLSLDELRGLYISDKQVDQFVNQTSEEDNSEAIATLTARADTLRLENHRFGNDLPWFRLIEMFNLSPSEEDLLLVAIA